MRSISPSTFKAAPGERITFRIVSPTAQIPVPIGFSGPKGYAPTQVPFSAGVAEYSFAMPPMGRVSVSLVLAGGGPRQDVTYDVEISGAEQSDTYSQQFVVPSNAPIIVQYDFDTDYPGPR